MPTCKECGKEIDMKTLEGPILCSSCEYEMRLIIAKQAGEFLAEIEPSTPMQYPAHGAKFGEDVKINGVRYSVEMMEITTVQLKLRPVPIEGE